MNIFKTIIILAGISVSVFCANIEEAIRQNEVVIDALQKQLDSMQTSGENKESVNALQAHIDTIIEQQNKLLAQKISPNAENIKSVPETNDFDSRVRHIVQEELAKSGNKASPSNPYDTTHVPTTAELAATKAAESKAPALPEQKSEAVAQYEVALRLYEQSAYKEAAAGFGRIIKTYPNDPIVGKALVHLAYCLEKQGDAEGASVVCEAALKKGLDDLHQVDCQIMRLRFAKAKNNTEEVNRLSKDIQNLPLTAEQQKAMSEITHQPATVKTTRSAKTAA